MTPLFTAALFAAALLGLVIGSFLSVLVVRLPKGEPVGMARSRCPHCGRRLGAAELLPLLSWLMQRGRCRGCGVRISAFYPTIEIAAALVAVAAAFVPWPLTVAACLLGWTLVGVGAWALRRRMLGLAFRPMKPISQEDRVRHG
jgi:leader peptidase (prepilin peptidase)/N-methyltransferase